MVTKFLRTVGFAGACLLGAMTPALALDIDVVLVDENGVAIPDFRWLLEEDNTTFNDPANIHGDLPGESHANTLGLQFHKGYAAPIDSGCVGDQAQSETGLDDPCAATTTITVPDSGRYYLTALPFDGHRLAGVAINADALTADPGLPRSFQLTASGLLNPATGNIEVPTAQMTIFAFLDEAPLNNAPDGGEPGLADFAVLIEDAGGKYGASGGQLVADVFGNPLGTTYQRTATGEYAGYDADGVPLVETIGTGVLKTDANGLVTIRNLAPAKYGVKLVPPPGSDFQQVTTIEGTPVIDAWLLPNESSFFVEFGAPVPFHVFMGFARPTPLDPSYQSAGGATVTGTVHAMHTPRPPDVAFDFGARWDEYNAASPCWVGLNDMAVGGGQMILAQECGPNSSFSFPDLIDGTYQLVVWDRFLDGIIAFVPITIAGGECSANGVNGSAAQCNLGKVGMFPWFGRIDNYVFFDTNENGVMDPGEPGIPEQAVNLRFRDGTIYQSFPTDLSGYVPFDQVFPFFNWLIAEVDFARFKATGLTAYVDEGGELDVNAPGSRYGSLQNPQLEGYDGTAGSGTPFRTDFDSVLTQAYQAFLGSVSVVEWGKSNYANGESGGISGIVYYAVTRAEDDPKLAAAEPWEPGIPRVEMALYLPCPNPGAVPAGAANPNRDAVCETVLDPETSTWVNGPRRKVAGSALPAFPNRPFREPDVDNYPFNFQNCKTPTAPGCAVGPEDIDHNGNGRFDPNDAVAISWTDSFDDNTPDDCPAAKSQIDAGTANKTQAPFVAHPGTADQFAAGSCFDGLRPFNQFRAGVFDGGFAFETYTPTGAPRNNLAGSTPLVDGDYIVEAITPPHLKHLTSQARNVDFGENFGANTNALPFDCGGPKYLVPAELTLFPGVAAPLAGTYQNLCNMRTATLRTGMSGGGFNAGAEFWMYTDVPKAARIVGISLDDLANQNDPANPSFGEKYAPPFLPVAIRDYNGVEISRVYTDEFGGFNALVPSTFSVNLPSQSGVSPNMLQACMNDAIKPDGSFDPAFKREYGTVCYTLQYVPGSTTYLDTPVLRLSAFASNNTFPLDCECQHETPVIHHVESAGGAGAVTANPTETFTVISMGDTLVPNPDFDQNVEPAEVLRDFGFGATPGRVFIGGVEQTTGVVWTNDMITFDRDPASPASGDLVIERSNGARTKVGVQIIYDPAATVHVVTQGQSIQDAIDLASPGDIVSVKSGLYNESLILTKNIRLQGVGARGTVINGKLAPATSVTAWQSDIANRVSIGEIDLLPEQAFSTVAEVLLTEVGAPLSVFGRGGGGVATSDFTGAGADGLMFTAGNNGGGVLINAYVPGFTLSNDIIAFNAGDFGGGVRIGVVDPSEDPVNDNITLRNSRIVQNGGGVDGGTEGPGGVAIYAGADGYQIRENVICGNFSFANGAGIGHIGLSDNGLIADNQILFNQGFDQASIGHGGGLFIAGSPLLGEGLRLGAGNVQLTANLIQGNQAGAGNGGALAVHAFNGADAAPGDATPTHQLTAINNTIVNNVTGENGVIVLGDLENGVFFHNTIAFNDSTATTQGSFTGPNGFSESVRQVSGIFSLNHSADLLGALGAASGFSDPVFLNNIVWHNRACFWSDNVGGGGVQGIVCDDGSGPVYDEFAVQGGTGCIGADNSVVSDLTDPDLCAVGANVTGDPSFVAPSFLTSPSTAPFTGEGGAVQAFAAFDEGGNFIDVNFGLDTALDPGGQLTPKGDFRLTNAGSSAQDIGAAVGVAVDFEGDARPFGAAADAGSDEISAVAVSTIAITSAAVTEVLANGRVRVYVTATSDLGANADLTLTLLDNAGAVIAENLAMVYRPGPAHWDRLRTFDPRKFDLTTMTAIVQGPEGSASAPVDVTLLP